MCQYISFSQLKENMCCSIMGDRFYETSAQGLVLNELNFTL